jgi:muramoyltetrapeptide carboxypeptidase
VNLAVEVLESWGLKVRVPANTFAPHPFHSNEDQIRLELLKKALNAKDSKAVWCLRGGYGANRLLPQLWKLPAGKNPKALIGYSDITSIHTWIQQKWKWVSFHGPLLETLISGRLSFSQMEELRQVLFGEKTQLHFKLEPLNKAAKKKTKLKAPVTGGNLVVLDSAIGTHYAAKLAGHILAIEDVGERGYRIDRMLEHLNQSGALKNCKAILFGDFSKGNEPDGSNHVQFAIERFASAQKIPCFQGLEIGHGEKNRILPFGVLAELRMGDQAQLSLMTGLR